MNMACVNHSNIEEISFTFEWNLNRLSEFEQQFGLSKSVSNNNNNNSKVNNNHEKSEWFTPDIGKHEDLLFWNMYIMLNGEDAYSFFKNKTEVKQKVSFEWIDKFRDEYNETRTLLKKYHLSIDDCINDLASSKCISIETFVAISIVLGLPVVLKRGHLLFDYSYGKKECYLFDLERTERKTDMVNVLKMRNAHIVGKYLDKPFMSKSFYKRDDLVDMCNVLNIDEYNDSNKRKTKDLLWNEIMKLN